MNKNYLVLGVVALLLLGGLGYFLLRPQAPVPESIPVSSPTPATNGGTVMEKEVIVEVDYTATGFSLATVTVKKGTTVKFINKSGGSMSVASNPHPIHTDYPGFDQYKSSQKGQNEYDFTFDKVGTWGYHNHLNASDGGTVIVTE